MFYGFGEDVQGDEFYVLVVFGDDVAVVVHGFVVFFDDDVGQGAFCGNGVTEYPLLFLMLLVAWVSVGVGSYAVLSQTGCGSCVWKVEALELDF